MADVPFGKIESLPESSSLRRSKCLRAQVEQGILEPNTAAGPKWGLILALLANASVWVGIGLLIWR